MSGPLSYMSEPWFALLKAECSRPGVDKSAVAARLGYSAPVVYQVLNGSGLYGKGTASTARLAEKVLHQLGSYECPHLTEQHGESRVISSDECRVFAHRGAPIGSPRDLAHWQACRRCTHRPLAAPAEPRVVVPRKGRDAGSGTGAAHPATATSTSTNEGDPA